MNHNEWKPYLLRYDKILYDIKLYNGKEYFSCYPNAGDFHTKCGNVISGHYVDKYRISNVNN